MTQNKLGANGRNAMAPAVIFLAATVVCVGAVSPYALLTIVLDGLGAAVIMIPAVLGGLCVVSIFKLGAMPLRWHLLLGANLGVGLLSLLVLAAGLAGRLHRTLWVGVLALAAIAGVVRLRALLSTTSAEAAGEQGQAGTDESNAGRFRWLWLIAIPFAALALLAAAHPPGFLWSEEGFGYDVLEYHLQLPKEYYQSGVIGYMLHNVYANFPANVEMLYLLSMIVLRDVADIGVVTNLIHTALGVLAVFAIWVAGCEWSPRAGVVSAVLFATTGWLVYLCGLSYVENGMLFFGATSLAILLRLLRTDFPVERWTRFKWLALAGLMAGFACGCKYTAVPMIAAPLLAGVLLLPTKTLSQKILGGAIFAMAMLVAFSPWLIKNLSMTGNPVFPLVNEWFGSRPLGWGGFYTRHWNAAHTLSGDSGSASQRVAALWTRIAGDGDQRFGPVILALGVFGIFAAISRHRKRSDILLALVLIAQVGVWMFATHLFARFAVVLLIPLALLGGRIAVGGASRYRLIVYAMVAGAAWNLAYTVRLYARESPGVVPASLIYDGELPGFEYFKDVNHSLPDDAHVLLVGDAKAFYYQCDVDYCVAFNRNMLFLRSGMIEGYAALHDKPVSGSELPFLQNSGYTHVLVNWTEVQRLSRTYGFSPPISVEELSDAFERMTADGLVLERAYPHPQTGGRYVELYSVPPK